MRPPTIEPHLIGEPESGTATRPALRTLGQHFSAHLRLTVWCKACRHQIEPAVVELVERHGAGGPEKPPRVTMDVFRDGYTKTRFTNRLI
jgi:hypothetical protein